MINSGTTTSAKYCLPLAPVAFSSRCFPEGGTPDVGPGQGYITCWDEPTHALLQTHLRELSNLM